MLLRLLLQKLVKTDTKTDAYIRLRLFFLSCLTLRYQAVKLALRPIWEGGDLRRKCMPLSDWKYADVRWPIWGCYWKEEKERRDKDEVDYFYVCVCDFCYSWCRLKDLHSLWNTDLQSDIICLKDIRVCACVWEYVLYMCSYCANVHQCVCVCEDDVKSVLSGKKNKTRRRWKERAWEKTSFLPCHTHPQMCVRVWTFDINGQTHIC